MLKIDYDYDYVIDWKSISNRLLFRQNKNQIKKFGKIFPKILKDLGLNKNQTIFILFSIEYNLKYFTYNFYFPSVLIGKRDFFTGLRLRLQLLFCKKA